MAAKNKAAKAGAAALALKNSPYIKKIADDEELRANLFGAFESARTAVGRLQNGKHPTKQIFDDKKLQKDLREAAESFKEVSVALHEAPKQKKRRGGFGTVLLVGIVGGAVALVVSEDLRKKVLDALFGAEEEFEYTSTTSPVPPAPEPSSTT